MPADAEVRELQALLDAVPAPLEPLDVSMADGFLCGVLVQPRAVPASRWLPRLLDVEARRPPSSFDAGPLRAAALRRHAALDAAIVARRWFDPWVFDVADEAGSAAGDVPDGVPDGGDDGGIAGGAAIHASVLPWAAGFVLALETFPSLLERDDDGAIESLALLYRHVGTHSLDDAQALELEIESLEPPADLAEAIEELVRATLLLADLSRPLAAGAGVPQESSQAAGPVNRGRKPRR